jgi:serine/threonine protein kinase
MMDQIKQGLYKFPSPAWDSVSEPAIDLVMWLMQVDVSKRATVEQALEHPWMQMDDTKETVVEPTPKPVENDRKRRAPPTYTAQKTELLRETRRRRRK